MKKEINPFHFLALLLIFSILTTFCLIPEKVDTNSQHIKVDKLKNQDRGECRSLIIYARYEL